MSPELIGIIGIILLILLFITGMPVSFAMAFIGFLGFGYLMGFKAGIAILLRDFFEIFSAYPLNVIVLFVLMGSFAFASGMSRRLYDACYTIAGQLPAGLAVTTILACSGFAAICGSTAATAATIGRVAFTEMQRYGYSDTLSTGSIASAGAIGILIPPSTIFIVYGILTEQSIGQLFAAGILPGVMLTIFFICVVFLLSAGKAHIAPVGKQTTLAEKFKALLSITDVFLLFAVSIGGLLLGWFTPNQAAGMGAAGTLLIGLINRELTWKGFFGATKQGLHIACMILCLIAGATVFGHFMAASTIPLGISDWIGGLSFPPIVIMAILCLIFFIGGCFIDAMALIMLTVPILYPIVLRLGYDLIWFGVVIVIISQIAVITPPVGVNVYVTKGIAKSVKIETIFKGTLPFLGAMIIALIVVLVFPQLSLFLPNLVK